MHNIKNYIIFVFCILLPFSTFSKSNIADAIESEEEASAKPLSKTSRELKQKLLKPDRYIKKQRKESARARMEIEAARKRYPNIDELHNSTMNKAADGDPSVIDESGMNIALKRLAADFEKQFLTIMYRFMSAGVGQGDNFANSFWASQREASIIEAGDELGEIGRAIYEDLESNQADKDKIKKGS